MLKQTFYDYQKVSKKAHALYSVMGMSHSFTWSVTAFVGFLISVRNHAHHGSLSAVTLQVTAEAAFTLELTILRFLSRKT